MGSEKTHVQLPSRRALLLSAIAPVVFAALTIVLLHSVLFQRDGARANGGGGLVLSAPNTDLISQFIPWRQFGFDQLRNGNLPLWNPHVFGGAPYFAGFQAALLYPPNWLHLLLALTTAINWIIALHLLAAGYFTYLWCRGRGASIGAAILAGIMFMFSGPYFLHIYAGHLPHLCVMVWVPLLFLSIDKLNETGSLHWCLLGVLAVAMQIFGGHPQYLYYTGIVSFLYAAIVLIRSKHRLALAGGYVIIFAGASLLGAVQLLSGFQAAGESARSGGTDFAFASMFALPPENLLTFLAPDLLGRLPQIGDSSNTIVYFGRCYLWEMSVFLSISGLVIASIGAVVSWRKTLALSVMVCITAVLALGRHLPLYRPLYDYLPEYGSFRSVSKFTFPMCLFICVLAAAGFDALLAQTKAIKVAALVTAVIALILTLTAVRLGVASKSSDASWSGFLEMIANSNENFVPPPAYQDAAFVRGSAKAAAVSIGWAAASMTTVCLLLWATRWKKQSAYGLIILATLELFVFAHENLATTLPDLGFPSVWLNPIRAAQADGQRDIRVVNGPMPDGNEVQYLDAGMSLGFNNLWGYDPGVLKRYAQTLAASQGIDPDSANQYLQIRKGSLGLFQMLRCRFALQVQNGVPNVMEVLSPLPVAQLVSHWVVRASRDEELAIINSSNFDPRKIAVLESDPGITESDDGVSGPAEVVAESTDWIEIRTQTPAATMLLITNNYSTGWRVVPLETTDQTEYKILPANHTLMAIPLQAGSHHIRIEYLPMAYRVGKWISIAAVLGYAGTLSAIAIRRRVPPDAR